jgi:hypothetical protein
MLRDYMGCIFGFVQHSITFCFEYKTINHLGDKGDHKRGIF